MWSVPVIGGLLTLGGIATAFLSVCNSSEMLALARPGNETMATAFSSTGISLGTVVSRVGTAGVLASGALAPEWNLFGRAFGVYQTLFLFFGIASIFFLFLIVLLPSVIPTRHDYYAP